MRWAGPASVAPWDVTQHGADHTLWVQASHLLKGPDRDVPERLLTVRREVVIDALHDQWHLEETQGH